VSEPRHDAVPSFGGDDPVSPELALVDSALRERLLEAEADRILAVPFRVATAASGSALEPAETIRPEPARHGRRIAIAIFALLVVLVGAAAVWHARHRANPAPTGVAPAATTGVDPAATTNSGTAQTSEAAAGRPTTRTFAWAPTSRAVAYHVEIRRGDNIVYSTRTRATRVSVRLRSAQHKGAPLSPGTYRWYVWPLLRRNGHANRRGAAIVATTIVVGR